MNKFDKIYLSWRPSKGISRIIIGEILIDKQDVKFTYLEENLYRAKQLGFTGYPGLSIEKNEHTNVLDLFSKRLINTDRSDSKHLLKFWNVNQEYKDDKLYLLAMTQGINQTDNFEFLANYELTDKLDFVTDIAGLSYSKFDLTQLKKGLKLEFEKENHKEDSNAIKILFNKKIVGYIKRGHNIIFQEADSNRLQIEVKEIINNPQEKKLFVRIFLATE